MNLAQVTLNRRTVLLVEDDFLIAMDVAASLEEDGARVVGPAATVSVALDLISQTESLDAAILDINLRGTTSYAIADVLRDRGVPIVFVTGYDKSIVPDHYADVPICQKPFDLARCSALLFE
ncbi:Response regulator receiver domain-containing protein [Citreimonas salinaria]|uniref:Response regulator receiver domain-containing protein n=1 Tax=Citreimonas salinaria TaxID=321339 RepID=A0A1H3NTR6_9RHOB|nr:Response regulator receiver domain-containing protein [Citreimonas salinaria]